MTPDWRKPVGMLGILLLIFVWSLVIVSVAGMVGRWHWVLQFAFYLFAGIIWITPLKPLLRWMETGRWRA